jgi:hypothetical protein
MPSFLDLLVVAGMFMLRVGVPVLVIVGAGYLLKRLDARWEAEARAYAAKQAAAGVGAQPAAQKPVERPVAPVRAPAPGPAMPFIIPPTPGKEPRIQPGMSAQVPAPQPGKPQQQNAAPGLAASAQHCWDVKGCGEAKAQCAAFKNPDKPCWQARFDAEGHIPEDCVGCDIFQRYPAM